MTAEMWFLGIMLRTPWADITTYGAILQEAGDNHKLIKEIKQTDSFFFQTSDMKI